MRKHAVLLPLPFLLMALLFVSCTDSDLNKVASALVVVAKTNGEIQTITISANNLKLLPEDNTRIILETCQKINLAGKEATDLTRTLNKLDNPSKAQILKILQPMIATVGSAVDKGLIGITDQATRDKIKLLLLSLQSTLNSIQLIIAGGA
jgi:hypothetical protein